MNVMKYNGFIGTVAYSEEDDVFFGKIEGINSLVNFEGTTVADLKKAFHEAVDDYLAYCEEHGLKPEKSYTGVLNVRLSPEIHRRIALLAQSSGKTINSLIKDAVENQLNFPEFKGQFLLPFLPPAGPLTRFRKKRNFYRKYYQKTYMLFPAIPTKS